MSVYTFDGCEFRFGDLVVMEFILTEDALRVGRLVQVRRGAGPFKTDLYLIRLHDGTLRALSNVKPRRADDEAFVKNFYIANGRRPPTVYPEDEYPKDDPNLEYSLAGYTETGFVIENPKQPPDPKQSFIMTITKE